MIKQNWKQNLFYFPTNILLLDDDEAFVKEIKRFLNGNDILVKAFHYSKEFFHYIANNALSINPEELFQKKEVDYYNGSAGILRTHLNSVYKIAYNSARFNQIGVVIVDYELNNETGIDVCKCIKNPYIKKIMLTSKASYKIAIDAMNKKIIDAFVFKSEILDSLIDVIKSLEIEYFYELSKKMQHVCEFMSEPFVSNLIDIYIQKKNPKEYYLFHNNNSFLFLDENGKASGLLIESESTIHNIEQAFLKDNISPDILIPLSERKKIPSGWNPSKYLLGDYDIKMVDCNFISGNKEDYYYYYSDNQKILGIDNDKIFPFIEKINDNFM